MEDVLDVYTRPSDPRHPQVCLDEISLQLLGDVAEPLPMQPGQKARQDYEYERHGITNLFLCYEPLHNWRHVTVTERRTKMDWAHTIRDLVDVHYPEAERIVLVMDNLNTHSPASLYEAFPPAEAKRLADRLEIHHTPKHGSWLNVAEIESRCWIGSAWTAAFRGGDAHGGGGRLGGGAEYRRDQDRLAFHDGGRAHQAATPVSSARRLIGHYERFRS